MASLKFYAGVQIEGQKSNLDFKWLHFFFVYCVTEGRDALSNKNEWCHVYIKRFSNR